MFFCISMMNTERLLCIKIHVKFKKMQIVIKYLKKYLKSNIFDFSKCEHLQGMSENVIVLSKILVHVNRVTFFVKYLPKLF